MYTLENFELYLDRFEVPADEIWSHLDSISPDCAVVATGSVPNGFANRHSDIDLLLLGDGIEAKLRDRFHFDHGTVIEHLIRLSNGHELNVFTMTERAVEEFSEKLSFCGKLLREPEGDVENIPLLSRPSYRLLDDVASGVVLRGEEEARRFRAEMLLEDVSAHVLLVSITDHLVAREDAIGHIDEGRCESALMLIREAIVSLSEAVLASVGTANTRLQWRFALLDENAAQIGQEVVNSFKNRILNPEADPARIVQALENMSSFSDGQLAAIMGRVGHLVPAFAKLSQHQSFHIAPPDL